MSTIADFPTEPRYTIKSVCARTGIRAVTLRAWERRYDLLNPQRGENLYRLYSEQEVALLRWIKHRVDNGQAISSAVRELKNMQAKDAWPEPIPTQPAALPTWDRPPGEYASELYANLVHHDDTAANEILLAAQKAFDLSTLCLNVITPCLVRIGEAWASGEIHVATEHFASGFIRGKLLNMMQGFPLRRNAPLIFCGCPPDELHEIGSLMLALLLRKEGLKVEYLGPDLPLPDLVDYARYERPKMICLAVTLEEHVRQLSRFEASLKSVRPTPLFGFGGSAFNYRPAFRNEISGHFLGESLDEAVEKVKALVL